MGLKRRDFLRAGACIALGGAGVHTALGNLRLLEATTRAYGPKAFSDYKALVCVFLLGGNDAMNTVIPYDTAGYQRYAQARATLAVPRAKVVRGFSMFGASYVYVIFEDGTDIYWARSRVLEYLSTAASRLPQGVAPQIGLISIKKGLQCRPFKRKVL